MKNIAENLKRKLCPSYAGDRDFQERQEYHARTKKEAINSVPGYFEFFQSFGEEGEKLVLDKWLREIYFDGSTLDQRGSTDDIRTEARAVAIGHPLGFQQFVYAVREAIEKQRSRAEERPRVGDTKNFEPDYKSIAFGNFDGLSDLDSLDRRLEPKRPSLF